MSIRISSTLQVAAIILVNHLITAYTSGLLERFMMFNTVPTTIPLGVLSNSSSTITVSRLVQGICFQYDIHHFVRCRFYSDCCAMSPPRPLEQLAAGTFSCHDGYYMVDKCPPVTTDSRLRELCEGNSDSEPGMRHSMILIIIIVNMSTPVVMV